jgi:hypothetical protein
MRESKCEPAATGDAADEMGTVKALLQKAGVVFREEAAGQLVVDGGPDDCLIEVTPDSVRCLFGVDMGELRLLVSGSGNEDLGEDELQRVAREQLRPLQRRYQPVFTAAGFQEDVVVDADSLAIAFVKPTAGLRAAAIAELVQWSCRVGRPAESSGAAP